MGKRQNPQIQYSALCTDPETGAVYDATFTSDRSPAYWPGDIVEGESGVWGKVQTLILGVIFREVKTEGRR